MPMARLRAAGLETSNLYTAFMFLAAQRLRASAMAREVFGDAFVEHYAATREWEVREFRRHVTDWELARYFEII